MAVDLQESRKKINAIDAQIARLFEERMQVSTDVARYKMETGKPIFDPDRERQVIERIKERFPYRDEEFRGALAVLFQTIMDLGKEHQKREMARISEPKVAYFGLPGAFTHEAMEQFFGAHADASHFLSTQEIFQAVEEGKVRYGVVPIENSTTGIIQDVYDGLSQYNLYIVREGVVPITQNLLGVPGATLEDVREVYSHAQGFAQSEQFFSKHPDWNLIPYFNTAKGAEHVSKMGDKAKACVASLKAAESEFERFKQAWSQYPGAVDVWVRNWEHVAQLFQYGSAVRKILYTTNAVESVNSSFRKVTKKGAFPNETALLKLLYLRITELYKKWNGRPLNNWALVRNQLDMDEKLQKRIRTYENGGF